MIKDLTVELKMTQEAVKKYNDLVGNVNTLMEWRLGVMGGLRARRRLEECLREWSGWAIAVLLAILNLYLLYGR